MGPPHESNAGYSLAKRQVDLLNRQYNVAHHHAGQGSLFTSIIPTNIYGCHDNFNLEQSHVIPGLIHKAYITATEAKSKNSKQAVLRVCGSGKPLRQFIYAPDLAKLILWTLENYNDPEPLILCPDEDDEISIGNIAEIIAQHFSEIFSLIITVAFDLNHSDGQYRKTASNRKFRTLYPGFKFTPTEVGIRQVIDWFCLNYTTARK